MASRDIVVTNKITGAEAQHPITYAQARTTCYKIQWNETSLHCSSYFTDTANRIHDVVHRWLAGRNVLGIPDGRIQHRRRDNVVWTIFYGIQFSGTIQGSPRFFRIPGNVHQRTCSPWFLAFWPIETEIQQYSHHQSYGPWAYNYRFLDLHLPRSIIKSVVDAFFNFF